MDDIFRPRTEPELTLYLAFQKEAQLRHRRDFKTWLTAECHAVFDAAQAYAKEHGLYAPTLEEVCRQEKLAYGSADYAAKWAFYVTRLMKKDW